MKKNIIAISGDIASGKGSVCEIIKEKLNFEVYSASMVFRQMAREMNMTIVELGKYVEERPKLDIETDERMKEYATKNDNLILDGRMSWYVAPFAFKVYMKVDLDVAAKRVIGASRGKEDRYETVEIAREAIKERAANEVTRYKNVYNVDKSDEKNYDLVFDTTDKTPEECAKIILDAYIKWRNN